MSHISKGDVHAYLDGALGAYPEEAARHVRDHLDACPECAQLLESQRLLRQEASAIFADSAQGPVELDTLEELLARAAASDAQERAEGGEESERAGRARPSVGRRTYLLRWAAMVVISLGSGWLARDLMGPVGDVERGTVAESVVTEIGVRQDQQVMERDNAVRLADAESPAESPAAEAVGVVGGGADRGAGGSDDDAVLDQVQVQGLLARQRALAAVVPEVGPADASVSDQPADDRVEPALFSDELRPSAPAQDRLDRVFPTETRALRALAGVALSTTPFLVPGLPVRDVRLALEADGLAGGRGVSVVVTQELGDGRVVELEFVPLAGSDPRREDALQERNEFLGRTRPEGWGMAVRDVPGGVAVLSGPLTELELGELLDLALGLR